AATLATWPLLAHEFGAVSIAALPANLVAFPAVAPIMWIGMGEAALEQLAGPLAHAFEAVAAPVSAVAWRWVAAVATRCADPAWGQAEIHLSWPAVVATYAGLGGIAHPAARRLAGRVATRIRASASGPARTRV